MADSITIAGVSLRLIRFQERARTYRGELAEAFDNTLMDGRDKPKRTWDAETDWYPPATETTLRSAIASGPVTCSGLVLFGSSVTAVVIVESSTLGPDVSTGRAVLTAVNVSLTLTLREA